MRFGGLANGCPLLLVTGFGPFPGVRVNPSAELAQAVARSPRWRLLGVEARSLVLPTTYAALATELEPALDGRFALDAILMVGLATRATRLRIERRATSRANPLHPDASGHSAARRAPDPGPIVRRSPVPPPTVAALLQREGVPCRASNDAGRYLCNAAYYRTLAGTVPALFLHIPKLRDPARPRRPRRHRAARPDRLERAFVAVAVALLKQARNSRRAARASVAARLRQG